MNFLKISAVTLLDQLENLIEQLGDEDFSIPISILSEATIGQHCRHTLELFQCLCQADQNIHCILNYDLRERNHEMESQTQVAAQAIEPIKKQLLKIESDFNLTLQANYSTEDGKVDAIHSSFARELAYNIEHTIHHMALIKAGIKALNIKVHLPGHFGVASSTIRHQKALQN